MVLAYLNAVQALYKHPSIGNPLNIVLVRMDIMKVQPRRLPHYDGDRSQLLNSFCEYQHELNSQDDQYDEHWDMALYVSGLDFFAYENGRKNGATMGLATVGGVCYSRYSCIIAEFGTTNIFGKPYPSAGFTSVYILAHEIGHNLGMHHDNNGNSCSKDGYIMSPSRGTQGETIWSPCSADVMYNLGWADCLKDKGKQKQQLNHSKFMEHPGMTYTAKRQCELLLRDKDAYVVPENDLGVICYSLRCQTPHRSGYYFAGPALEGTECGNNLYCYGGDCIKRLPKPITLKPGGWGPWRLSDCKSGCIEKSTGYQIQQRDCNNPSPLNTDKGCEGLSYQHVLCEDTNICKTNRKSAIQYASEKCKLFASKVPELDPKGAGLQSSHENNRLWMGCAIFCRRHEGSYYTPRIELTDVGIDPYFPDGTWCHNENGEDYYCNNRHCLAESFAFSKNWFKGHMSTNMDIPQNAIPNNVVPPEFKSFLSLGSDGKPLKIDSDFRISLPKNEDWETDDYVLLPNIDA
ncbi:ADAMTS cysteine-rich domain 2 [Popillia japonica]|uniref:ADAMTS cysteine-rich domain 2 n=1 Tax=Popillia japonica TaxID=7064 RepID=A0AAW1JG09_POPJA